MHFFETWFRMTVSRGPKPPPLQRELGAHAKVVVPEPNTWKEIVEAVAARPERRIAVQEYGRPNREMNTALQTLGASVTPIVLYRWELPADIKPLQMAARRLAESRTATPRIRRLREYTAVASVGPVMTPASDAAGIPVEMLPVHSKMGALVKAASD